MITKGNHGMCVNIITMGIFIRLLLNYSSDQAEFLSLSTEAFFIDNVSNHRENGGLVASYINILCKYCGPWI